MKSLFEYHKIERPASLNGYIQASPYLYATGETRLTFQIAELDDPSGKNASDIMDFYPDICAAIWDIFHILVSPNCGVEHDVDAEWDILIRRVYNTLWGWEKIT